MTLQERCDKATDFLIVKKKELEQLIKEYQSASEDGRSINDLLDVKDKLIALTFSLTTVMLRTKELHLEAQRERESSFTSKFLENRGSVDDKTNKPKSVEACKMMAQLSCAQEYMNESLSESNYYTAKFYRDDCQRVIDGAIQRISVLRGEVFNSRQVNNA